VGPKQPPLHLRQNKEQHMSKTPIEPSGEQPTVGDFRYGLASAEAHAEYNASLYREIEDLRGWGDVPAGKTFWDLADALLDAFFGSTSIASIPASDLASVITDALEQVQESDAHTTCEADPVPAALANTVQAAALRELIGEMETRPPLPGTMPGVRLQEGRRWAAHLRALLPKGQA
jgi:hypothetical protein